MKNAMMMLAIVAVVGLVFSVAMGDNPQQQPIGGGVAPAGEKPVFTPSMSGTITKVDGEKVTLQIPGRGTDKGVDFIFVTDSKTDVTLDGKIVKVSDLKEGQKAVVSYTTDKDKTMTATKLEATSAK